MKSIAFTKISTAGYQLTKEYKLKMPIPHLLKKSLHLRKYLAPIIKKNKRIEQKKLFKNQHL